MEIEKLSETWKHQYLREQRNLLRTFYRSSTTYWFYNTCDLGIDVTDKYQTAIIMIVITVVSLFYI